LFKFKNCSDFNFCSNLKIFQKSSNKKEKIPDVPRPSLPPVRAGCAARPSHAANGRRIEGPRQDVIHVLVQPLPIGPNQALTEQRHR
jgi:hypothetical protein